MRSPLLVRCAAELVGTALLVGVGTGSIVEGTNVGGVTPGVLAVAWFVAVAIPVLAFAALSGAHINPVVTLALVSLRRFPLREAGPYVLSQVAGAFAGSLAVLAVVGGAARLGATIPRGGDVGRTFVLEVAFTALLILTVLYLTDPGRRVTRWELLLPALAVGVSTYLIGPWTGSSLNPARTLAPGVLSGSYEDMWVYMLSAPVGALLMAGAWAGAKRRSATRDP